MSRPFFNDSYSSSSVGSVSPYITLSYDVIPRRFNLAFEYDHYFSGDESHSGSSTGTWINQSRNLYALHLWLAF